jgi:hypothetical protein
LDGFITALVKYSGIKQPKTNNKWILNVNSTGKLLNERQYGRDPIADHLVEAIVEHAGKTGKMEPIEVAQMLSNTARFGPKMFHELCDHHPTIAKAMKDFLLATQSKVPWANRKDLAVGNHPFEENAVLGFVALGCVSLLDCYCWANEAEVLGLTHQMSEHLERRIPETAQFVIDVMSDNALIDHDYEHGDDCDPENAPKGIRAIQKIRLMHALMRWLILFDPGNASDAEGDGTIPAAWEHLMRSQWSIPVQGYPISQTFMAGTLLTFSWVVIKSMRKMWATVSKEHGLEYLHIWKIIGYKLGVDEDLLAFFDTEESAADLHQAMMENYRAPTQQGVALAMALERYMVRNIVDHIPAHKLFGMHKFPRIAMWHLCGPDTARTVGMVPGLGGRTFGWVVWQGLRTVGFMSRLPVLKHLSLHIFAWLGRAMWGWRHADDEVDHSVRRPRIVASHANKWKVKRKK